MFDVLKWVFAVIWLGAAFGTAGHALVNKRDPRAALGWIVVSLTIPLAGPLLYFFFGVNRIRTRAMTLPGLGVLPDRQPSAAIVSETDLPPEFSELAGISGAVSTFDLTAGNSVEMLHSGEQAYPAMLRDIEAAEHHVFLSTYIFETNRTGREFIEALARASERGVETRVIIDGVGRLYSHPRADGLLAKRGVKVARFLPPRAIPPSVHMNLRNHRKILIADGRVAFTGGMNIGDRHLADRTDNPDRLARWSTNSSRSFSTTGRSSPGGRWMASHRMVEKRALQSAEPSSKDRTRISTSCSTSWLERSLPLAGRWRS